jgi:hypothetical protein
MRESLSHAATSPADARRRHCPVRPRRVNVKGSTIIAIKTIAGFLAVTSGCPVNIKLFIEGEEESRTPSLRGIVEHYRDKLAADAMLSWSSGGRLLRRCAPRNDRERSRWKCSSARGTRRNTPPATHVG